MGGTGDISSRGDVVSGGGSGNGTCDGDGGGSYGGSGGGTSVYNGDGPTSLPNRKVM